jgi:hypothetical protein
VLEISREIGHDAPTMGLELIPEHLRQRYHFEEREHACAILANDFTEEFAGLLDCLDAFCLRRSYITSPRGAQSLIPKTIDGFLQARRWQEKSFGIDIRIDQTAVPVPTNKIDDFKNSIGV